MRDQSTVVELKKQKLEAFIRETFHKPTEPITLGDVINIKPWVKIYLGFNFESEYYINNKVYQFELDVKKSAFETENEQLLELYKALVCKKDDRKYQKLFGLSVLVGATDIYDIACGFNFQAGYIAYYKGISYTGIDREKGIIHSSQKVNSDGTLGEETRTNIPVDFEKYTEMFAKLNDNIKFVNAEYPYEIKAKKNNIAIAVGYHSFKDNEAVAKALSRDFERIILQVDCRELEKWKELLSEFALTEIYRYRWNNYFTEKKVDGWCYLFGTKFPEELEYLKEAGYRYYDDRFYVDEVDKTRYVKSLEK